MTAKEMASLLNGAEYGSEISSADEVLAKRNGLLVLFGASDDLIELRGVIHDEVGINEERGVTLFLHRGGLLKGLDSECEECKLRAARLGMRCAQFDCLWNVNGYSWFISGRTPEHYEVFDIMENGRKYCRGIVIDVKNLPEVEV